MGVLDQWRGFPTMRQPITAPDDRRLYIPEQSPGAVPTNPSVSGPFQSGPLSQLAYRMAGSPQRPPFQGGYLTPVNTPDSGGGGGGAAASLGGLLSNASTLNSVYKNLAGVLGAGSGSIGSTGAAAAGAAAQSGASGGVLGVGAGAGAGAAALPAGAADAAAAAGDAAAGIGGAAGGAAGGSGVSGAVSAGLNVALPVALAANLIYGLASPFPGIDLDKDTQGQWNNQGLLKWMSDTGNVFKYGADGKGNISATLPNGKVIGYDQVQKLASLLPTATKGNTTKNRGGNMDEFNAFYQSLLGEAAPPPRPISSDYSPPTQPAYTLTPEQQAAMNAYYAQYRPGG